MYQLKNVIEFHIPKRLKRKVLKLRLFRYFYMYFSKYTLYKWFQHSLKGVNYFIEEYLRLLEGNLMMLSYRMNFISNLFTIPFIIMKGHFMINFEQKFDYREAIHPGDVFGVCYKYLSFYQKDIYIRLSRGILYQTGPKNIYFFRLMLMGLFYKPFRKDSFINPIKIDILRVHDMFRDFR